eukprot:365134-Chlamydomonas_euryale.AAC.2
MVLPGVESTRSLPFAHAVTMVRWQVPTPPSLRQAGRGECMHVSVALRPRHAATAHVTQVLPHLGVRAGATIVRPCHLAVQRLTGRPLRVWHASCQGADARPREARGRPRTAGMGKASATPVAASFPSCLCSPLPLRSRPLNSGPDALRGHRCGASVAAALCRPSLPRRRAGRPAAVAVAADGDPAQYTRLFRGRCTPQSPPRSPFPPSLACHAAQAAGASGDARSKRRANPVRRPRRCARAAEQASARAPPLRPAAAPAGSFGPARASRGRSSRCRSRSTAWFVGAQVEVTPARVAAFFRTFFRARQGRKPAPRLLFTRRIGRPARRPVPPHVSFTAGGKVGPHSSRRTRVTPEA